MQRRKSVRPAIRLTVLATVCAVVLSACSDSPTERVASAQKFLDKNDVNAASIELKSALQKDPKLAEARYLLGTVNLRQGDAAGAVKELRRASEFGVSALRVSPVLARALLRQGEVDQVLKEFEGVRLEEPGADAQLLAVVGEAHLRKGEVDQAKTAFDAALQQVATDPSARIGIGRVKFAKGDPDGAMRDADTVLSEKVAGNLAADAHALRADVLIARNKPSEAIAELDAAVKAQPDAINYHFGLISLLLQQDNLDGAATRLAAMQKVAAKHPLTRFLQATVDFRKGSLASARENVDEAVRLGPTYLPARFLAGLVHARLNEHLIALEHFNAVLAGIPNHQGARLALARSELALGDAEHALETLQPLLDGKSQDPEVLRLAGQIYVASGNMEAASRRFAELVTIQPGDAQARTQLGVTKMLASKGDSGIADLEAASKLESDDGEAETALILTYMGRGETERAAAVMRDMEAKHADDPKTYTVKGGVLLARKDVSGARRAFEKAVSLKTDYLPAIASLARMDIEEKRPQDAVARLEAVAQKSPTDVGAAMMLADVLVQTGAKPEAVRAVLERTANANPTATVPRLALIEHDLRQRDAKRALKAAIELSAAHPTEARVFGALGRAQLAADDKPQAVMAFTKQVNLAPRSVVPLIELSDAQRLSKDLDGAEQSLRRALALRADQLDAQQRLISLYIEEKRDGEALAVARNIQKQRPKAVIGLLLEADIHVSKKDWASTVAVLKRAMELEKAPQIVTRLHAAQLLAGKRGEADALVSGWLRNNPKDFVVTSYLADRAMAEGRLADAERLYTDVNRLKPNDAAVINNMAWLAGQRKDPQALRLAEQAASLAPSSAAVADTLGMLQVEMGQSDKGVESLRRAVSLAPNAPGIRMNLVRAFAKLGRKDEARKEVDLLLQSLPADSPSRAEAVALKGTL
ncbi:MAG TPA: XrtA/PEP-CTERM system TPR-repeat protein PrsT [Aromatoleum sp.]|uniref:XrtA/PEP-CTERM system TPR-repeat protein PrsT n=1 Tax=Aromatoleum sp. TaxID=2307007 RepID=UPI002B47C0DF|nr:XrtA/PEP-CTERM system TPR-repeat protein PrsT [Aromatoleum sp.]HJV26849.1 XrtA/PEP-CTERM system TPR-repeat protein PrsT [Aromatoleum sp.]